MSAAFDTVNHRILLETFKNYYGLDGTVLSWVMSYLSNRSCFVNVDRKHSKSKSLALSVPQGLCSEIEAILDLEDSAVDVKLWMDGVKLKLNPDKTEFILFGSYIQLQKCVSNNICIAGDKIERNNIIRYLGGFFFLNETASFRDHVKKKCSAAMINF